MSSACLFPRYHHEGYDDERHGYEHGEGESVGWLVLSDRLYVAGDARRKSEQHDARRNFEEISILAFEVGLLIQGAHGCGVGVAAEPSRHQGQRYGEGVLGDRRRQGDERVQKDAEEIGGAGFHDEPVQLELGERYTPRHEEHSRSRAREKGRHRHKPALRPLCDLWQACGGDERAARRHHERPDDHADVSGKHAFRPLMEQGRHRQGEGQRPYAPQVDVRVDGAAHGVGHVKERDAEKADVRPSSVAGEPRDPRKRSLVQRDGFRCDADHFVLSPPRGASSRFPLVEHHRLAQGACKFISRL